MPSPKNANAARDELETKLDKANSEIDRLKGELEQAPGERPLTAVLPDQTGAAYRDPPAQ